MSDTLGLGDVSVAMKPGIRVNLRGVPSGLSRSIRQAGRVERGDKGTLLKLVGVTCGKVPLVLRPVLTVRVRHDEV